MASLELHLSIAIANQTMIDKVFPVCTLEIRQFEYR